MIFYFLQVGDIYSSSKSELSTPTRKKDDPHFTMP